MDDLARWLGEQLDVDKARAEAATWCEEAGVWHAEPSPFGARDGGQRWYVEDAMVDGVVSHVDPKASDDEGVARHIAEWDPARVLREISAKRQLIARGGPFCTSNCDEPGNEPMDPDTNWTTPLEHHPDCAAYEAARVLAAVYADRPGFKEEYRP